MILGNELENKSALLLFFKDYKMIFAIRSHLGRQKSTPTLGFHIDSADFPNMLGIASPKNRPLRRIYVIMVMISNVPSIVRSQAFHPATQR